MAERTLLLVVEDDPSIRELLATSLRFAGFEVSTAATGNEALRAVERRSPDLVLLDVRLPDADGFNILERIRNNQKILKLPVIMMTGRSEVTDVARGLSLGADGYVTKPFKISGLISAVNTVLGIDQPS